MSLGENIYRLRTEKNMSQGDLADALDVSRQSVSKWENNSATPELEKLIRMCELFGVSLDTLAGREKAPQPEQPTPVPERPEPQIIYIEKPTLPHISKQQLIGAALLVGAFLYALLLNSSFLGLTETILMSAPVAVCGILCLFVTYPQISCGWVGAAAYWIYLFILFPRWEYQYTLLFLGVALVVGMIYWTVGAHRKGKIHVPTWLWILGGLILAALLFLLCINTLPPLHITVTEHPAIPAGQ